MLQLMTSKYTIWRVAGLALSVAAVGLVVMLLIFASSFLPELSARLVPILLLPVIALVALLSRNSRPISIRMQDAWLFAIVVVIILWPGYLLAKFPGLPTVDPRKIITGGGIVVLTYLLLSKKELSLVWRDLPKQAKTLTYLVSVLLAWRVASCAASESPIAAFISVVWEFVYFYSLFFVAIFMFGKSHQQELYRWVLISVGLLEALYAVIERVSMTNILLDITPRIPENAVYFAGAAVSRWRDGSFRAQGTFPHPLLLSEFGAFMACMSASMVLFASKRSSRWIGLVGCAAGCTCILVSGTRTGFIAAGAGMSIIGIAWIVSRMGRNNGYGKRFLFALFTIGALVISVPTITLLSEGQTASEKSSSSGRQMMFQRGIPAALESPLLGEGPGSAIGIAGLRGGNNVLTLDSYWLALAIDSGLIVLLLMMAMHLVPAYWGINHALSFPDASSVTIYGCSAALISMFIFRIVLATNDNMSLTFLTVGILATALHAKKRSG
jgi:O-antigen ligase